MHTELKVQKCKLFNLFIIYYINCIIIADVLTVSNVLHRSFINNNTS